MLRRRDVQTSSVSLSPRYSQNGEDIVGYTASNTVNATIRSVSRSGAVIDAAVGAGANQVYGPTFTRSDEAVLYRRALSAAVANARRKAQTLAGAAKVRLGPVRSIVESSVGPIPIAEKAAADAVGTPIEPGTQRIEASVTVEFASASRVERLTKGSHVLEEGLRALGSAISTAREPTTTPSAIRAAAAAWSGVEMPKPR